MIILHDLVFQIFCRFFDNAKLVSYSYKHRPHTALESAIWWVEYVGNTEGASLLKSTATYLSRFTYYSLDVYMILGLIAITSTVTWGVIMSKLRGAKRKQQVKTKIN